ncbi:M56 family metallopeptidase [Pedobacter gandavensis]|uniref:M56 family metallopeptidase n=1 Tax=Pedobacter gandavensis TaxID=2679963 RepID=UPI00292DF726|nr:M56 family metallopeptidase [Pedobacter gandavensis]
MMNWFYYLLEANLYLSIFYAAYRLLLSNETFYGINRFFLILSTIMAFLLPLLQMGYLNQLFQIGIGQQFSTALVEADSNESVFSTLNAVLYLLYVAVAIAFSAKLLKDLYQIVALSKRSERYQKDKVTYVSLTQQHAAFSFFNLLFIQPDIQGKETILKHELVHIRQRHSFDIIFFEIIQILNWFNPITYLLKKDIKLLHEYIADEQTTLKEIEKYDYALFLIKNSFGMESKPLSNHIFNQSILKQRINMLNKEKSTGRARLKLLCVLPMAAAMLGTSTMAFSKDYSLIDLYPEKPAYFSAIQEPVKAKQQKKTNSKAVPAASKAPIAPPPPPIEPRPVPPPPPPANNVKFPPPIVTDNVSPAAKKSKAKKAVKIKFAPPIVTGDANQNEKPPLVVEKTAITVSGFKSPVTSSTKSVIEIRGIKDVKKELKTEPTKQQ